MSTYLLIVGIPAAGKTTFGTYLEQEHGFIHLDFELDINVSRYYQGPDKFILSMKAQDKVVVTWGFIPQEQAKEVLRLKRAGFKVVWFDGDRDVALEIFRAREAQKEQPVPEPMYHRQIANINSSGVINVIQPRLITTFDSAGNFKPLTQLQAEVFASA